MYHARFKSNGTHVKMTIISYVKLGHLFRGPDIEPYVMAKQIIASVSIGARASFKGGGTKNL